MKNYDEVPKFITSTRVNWIISCLQYFSYTKEEQIDSGVHRIKSIITESRQKNESTNNADETNFKKFFQMFETQKQYWAPLLVPSQSFAYFPFALPCLLYEKYQIGINIF